MTTLIALFWCFENEFKKFCVLCRNFISIYKINRTLHGRLGIRILSFRAESMYTFSFSQLDLYMSVHQFLRLMMLQKKFLMSLMAGSEMGEDGNQLTAEQELRWGAKMKMLLGCTDECNHPNDAIPKIERYWTMPTPQDTYSTLAGCEVCVSMHLFWGPALSAGGIEEKIRGCLVVYFPIFLNTW